MKKLGTKWSEILRYGQTRGAFHARRLTTVKARCLYALRKINASVEQLPELSTEQLLAALQHPVNEQTLASFPNSSTPNPNLNRNPKPNDENQLEGAEKSVYSSVGATRVATSPNTALVLGSVEQDAVEGAISFHSILRGRGRGRPGRPRGSRSSQSNPRLTAQNDTTDNAQDMSTEDSKLVRGAGAETIARSRGRPGRPRGSRGLRPSARDTMPTMATSVSDTAMTIFSVPLSSPALLPSANTAEKPASPSAVAPSSSLSLSLDLQSGSQPLAVSPTTPIMTPTLSCN